MPEPKKKPKTISPQAAKILEQYRSAGKSNGDNSMEAKDEEGTAKPPPAPPPMRVQRSGTRGK